MTRYSSRTTSSTFSYATNRAPATRPRVMPAQPARSGHAVTSGQAHQRRHSAAGRLNGLVPLVCLTGQVSTTLIGSDAFRNAIPSVSRGLHQAHWLVKDVNQLAAVIHEAFRIGPDGRPGPVSSIFEGRSQFRHRHLYAAESTYPEAANQPRVQGDLNRIHRQSS